MSLNVFISYVHESESHSRNVLQLADRLRGDGVDCILDQYEQAPSEGWPRWMAKNIDQATYVLVICSETYDKRARGDELPGKGKGAIFESLLIYQEIYDNSSKNDKFIPVILDGGDLSFIPKPLRPFQYYQVSSGQGYEELYRRITGQPRILKPELASIKQLPVGINRTNAESMASHVDKEVNQGDAERADWADPSRVSFAGRLIELNINREFHEYSSMEQEVLLRAIRELLGVTGELRVISTRPGSVILISGRVRRAICNSRKSQVLTCFLSASHAVASLAASPLETRSSSPSPIHTVGSPPMHRVPAASLSSRCSPQAPAPLLSSPP